MSMKIRMLFLGGALLLAGAVQAKVVVTGTRVIYPAQEREIVVRLTNLATEQPSVLQVWLDDGDEKSSPDSVEVPFLITPPVFRMEPGSGQTLRLRYTGEPLPNDRESLYWLNVMEIPPAPDAEAEGEEALLVQFAYRTRLKTFFRPKGLSPAPTQAPEKLEWQLRRGAGKSGYQLQVSNPSPYFISFSSVTLLDRGRRITATRSKDVVGNMVAPSSHQQFALPDLVMPPSAEAQVESISISDYGNKITMLRPLSVNASN